ncbi:unnamed protein product [Cuscuta campestris]|uniref:Uncharacterized protein n=1 Tax=Cuscuta campestris TaxID=132261 RepID=A0A484N0J8_9ASTE|nr:unnamed protein product [Cuscuta campestris]
MTGELRDLARFGVSPFSPFLFAVRLLGRARSRSSHRELHRRRHHRPTSLFPSRSSPVVPQGVAVANPSPLSLVQFRRNSR